MCEICSRKDIPSLTQRKGKSDALRRFFPLFLCFSKRFSLRFGRRILSSRVALSASLARVLASIFVSYDQNLLDMTTTAMRIYSISFIFMGVNIFTSSFFTALNNGLISAIVSFARTLVLQIGAVMLLPMAFGLNGIWEAIIVAEGMAFVLDAIFLITNKKKYQY